MWKIHRYYLKEIGVNALLTFLVLFGMALISLLYKGIRLVQGGDLASAAITTLLLAADTFPHLLTVSLLFGTVLTFARASQDREITAIRSTGISPRVPMVAALLFGLICSMLGAWALHYQIPWAHYHKYRVVADLYKGAFKTLLKDQDRIALPDKDGIMTWQSKELEGGAVVYKDVSIFSGTGALAKRLGGSLGTAATLITADRVWFEVDEEGEVIEMFFDGFYVPATGVRVGTPSLRMNLLQMVAERSEADKDLRSDNLLSEVYRGVRVDPVAARYTVHRRACFALMPFLMAPIGFCIGVLSRERGRVLALSFCMVPLGLFYLCDFLGESILRHWREPLLGWLPALVTAGMGTPFCWRLLRV